MQVVQSECHRPDARPHSMGGCFLLAGRTGRNLREQGTAGPGSVVPAGCCLRNSLPVGHHVQIPYEMPSQGVTCHHQREESPDRDKGAEPAELACLFSDLYWNWVRNHAGTVQGVAGAQDSQFRVGSGDSSSPSD
jgi:hypothetical protein